MSDIKVRIYGEFNDKAFKKAAKQTSVLESQFKKLGGTLASVFAVSRVVAFGKASLKAFEDDQKAAARLAQTLKNLGLGFEDPRVEAYIKNLEKTTGILDDQLRPALQSLLLTTGSVTKSQQLLDTAINVSRGSTEELTTVAQDLAQAYVGNTKGLKKYDLGLTSAELSGKSFSEILTKINEHYSGQNAAYLETYAGKTALLNVAFANMQETIGQGLADAFSNLAGANGIEGAAQAMDHFAQQLSDAIVGVSQLVGWINKLPGMDQWKLFDLGNIPVAGAWLKFFAGQGEKARMAPKPFATPMTVSAQSDLYAKQDAARKKAEEEAAKRAKALAALQAKAAKDALAKEKANQQLKRAGTVFDMQNIQIVAALQGKVSEEQRLRLTALLAINNDNADAADKLTQAILALQTPAFNALGVTITTADNATTIVTKLINAQTQLLLLNSGIANIPKAKNPFEDWDKVMKTIIDNLDTITKKIQGIPKIGANTAAGAATTGNTGVGGSNTGNSGMGGSTVSSGVPNAVLQNPAISDLGKRVGDTLDAIDTAFFGGQTSVLSGANPSISNLGKRVGDVLDALDSSLLNPQPSPTPYINPAISNLGKRVGDTIINVDVTVQGNVTSQNDLVSAITDQLYQFQRNGGQIQLSSLAV